MNEELKLRSYQLIHEFLEAINSNNVDLLNKKFMVSAPILDEIHESLEDYFGERPKVELAPYNKAFEPQKSARPFIEIYRMNDDKTWGAECSLWVNGKKEEPILHIELLDAGGDFALRYKYIGS